MRIVFLGTPQFAVNALQQIHNSQHTITGIVCQPDKPSSRNKIIFSPVKQWALQHNIPLLQFEKLSTDEGVQALKQLQPDIMVTCAYGQMLSQQVIDVAPKGIINIHGSLLPHLRGASPIQSSILLGEKVTGITILKTVLKMDAGDIILQRSLNIGEQESCGELFERMSQLGGQCVVEALDLIQNGKATFTPQDHDKATFCKKITREQENIDWTLSATQINNLVRALCPQPAASTNFMDKQLKIFAVVPSKVTRPQDAKAGEVVAVTKKTLSVACGEGVLDIIELQPQNGKRMNTASFLCGNKIAVGTVLGNSSNE